MNAFRATAGELVAMTVNMNRIEAEELLQSGRVSDKDLYDVAMAAYGDERIASKMMTARIAAKQERGERTNFYR